jgi:hypothetical protein
MFASVVAIARGDTYTRQVCGAADVGETVHAEDVVSLDGYGHEDVRRSSGRKDGWNSREARRDTIGWRRK